VILDNAVWHSLRGPHRRFAEGTELAARFPSDVAPFGALPDDATPAAWAQLARVIGPGGVALLFRAEVTPPPEWETVFHIAGVQMVADTYDGEPAAASSGVVELGTTDVPAMLALVERTKPGPFFARTHELGRYIGLYDGERLVAMAGERLHCDGYTELSAVCTDEDHRGRGLATTLVADLVASIRKRGEIAMLHAAADNTNAIRLYESLGFQVRCRVDGLLLRAPAGADAREG
jgi:ribosomal protein S18 acetylase RimI-like enzyme